MTYEVYLNGAVGAPVRLIGTVADERGNGMNLAWTILSQHSLAKDRGGYIVRVSRLTVTTLLPVALGVVPVHIDQLVEEHHAD